MYTPNRVLIYRDNWFQDSLLKICTLNSGLGKGGVQKSSIINHRHSNVLCGMPAPQLVIFTTSIGNHCKILFSEILI